jgi:CxxC motif-containing protein (DUF1111 family)
MSRRGVAWIFRLARAARPEEWITLLVLAGLCGCEKEALGIQKGAGERSAGGETTVFDASPNAFSFPAANLSLARSDAFFVGNSFFKTNWVPAPASVEGRDGLGPLYNAASCSSCHVRDGRGRPPTSSGEPFVGLLLRISRADGTADPAYGDQIQHLGTPGVKPEAVPRVNYTEKPGTFADGTPYTLRRPEYSLDSPGYGELPSTLLISPRVAPAVFGLGLLETVPERRLLELADAEDADADGISGRLHSVLEVRTGRRSVGRFGWKANQPGLEQQCVAAFLGDIGITSPLFPEENVTPLEAAAGVPKLPGPPQIDRAKLDSVIFYLKTLAPPGRRDPEAPLVIRGQELFFRAGCQKCHTPSHTTGVDPAFPELSRQTIFPYTDLLLHDLGRGLADGRPDQGASGSEWRTPPLWGLGLVSRVNGHAYLLHDGRARGFSEAILWHDGEALRARESFRSMKAAEREALLAFLGDL